MALIVLLVVVALVVVVVLGLLIFRLQKRSQTVVPEVAERRAEAEDRVVAVDDAGRPVTESQEGPATSPREDSGFEAVLGESLGELHPEGWTADEPDDAAR